MSKILFLTQPMFGHFNPLFSIALQMQADGHEVEFMVPGRQGLNTNIGKDSKTCVAFAQSAVGISRSAQ